MVRIGLYSEDASCCTVLSSALGPEFQVSLEPSEDEVSQMLSSGSWDVVILDSDSESEFAETDARFLPTDRSAAGFLGSNGR